MTISRVCYSLNNTPDCGEKEIVFDWGYGDLTNPTTEKNQMDYNKEHETNFSWIKTMFR
jgi:hypothetical protein